MPQGGGEPFLSILESPPQGGVIQFQKIMQRSIFLSLILTITLFALIACQQTTVSAVPTATRGIPTPVVNSDDMMNQDVFEGMYAYGFETSAFVPCGVKEAWWVTPTNGEVGQELTRAYDATVTEQYRSVFARVRGNLSARGAYGHLGAYQREITVNEILDIRLPQTGDCAQ